MTSFLFSRVDGQGVGFKELRLTRELWLRCETRLYFGNGELMERETVVVGEQEGEKFAAGTRDAAPEPRGSRPSPAPPYPSLTLFLRLDHGFQLNVETIPVQTRPPRYAPISSLSGRFLTLEPQENPLSESLGASLPSFTSFRHTRTPQKLIHLQFGS